MGGVGGFGGGGGGCLMLLNISINKRCLLGLDYIH